MSRHSIFGEDRPEAQHDLLTHDYSNLLVSLHSGEVGDDVSAVLGVGDTSESHGVTRRVVSGRLDVLVDGLGRPLSLAGESTTKDN